MRDANVGVLVGALMIFVVTGLTANPSVDWFSALCFAVVYFGVCAFSGYSIGRAVR